ncbi:hypothetical protein JCM9534A_21190 [Catenuloplanes indicus JCM 9534]
MRMPPTLWLHSIISIHIKWGLPPGDGAAYDVDAHRTDADIAGGYLDPEPPRRRVQRRSRRPTGGRVRRTLRIN